MMGLKIGIRAYYAQEMEPDTLLKGTIEGQVKAIPQHGCIPRWHARWCQI
jgi:hypothetical protein